MRILPFLIGVTVFDRNEQVTDYLMKVVANAVEQTSFKRRGWR
jgi:hypothetical protein